jgi:hypothetical protein
MRSQKRLRIDLLPSKWFKHISKEEVRSEEEYHLLANPSCSEWAGLAALHSLAISELKYHGHLETCDYLVCLDSEPIITSNSLKSRLLSIAIGKADLLSFNEIRILNLLVDYDRKYVAERLGIKKSRLSQILKDIKLKIYKSE